MMSRNGYSMVQQFVTYFYKHIRDASPRDVETMYTLTFHKIGADFFANGPWPHMNELRHLVDDDVFWILYQVRHLRAARRCQPSAAHPVRMLL